VLVVPDIDLDPVVMATSTMMRLNHAPDFAPVPHPTLRVGIEAMLAAAGVWLAAGDAKT
jgi:hypothetical protein